MDDHAVELVVERNLLNSGVFPNTWNADIDVSFDGCSITKSESNDIGVGVVIEVLLIDSEQVLIAAKDVVQISDVGGFRFCNFLNPGRCFSGFRKLESRPFVEEVDARHS